MAKKEAKGSSGARPKKPSAARTGQPATGAYVRVPIKMPVAYIEILDSESGRYHQGRGEFLNMLVQRRAGVLQLTRSDDAPVYRVAEKDLAENGIYVWYVTPAMRDQIDSMRLRMGNVGLREFFIILLNEWLDRPHGLDLET